MSTTSTQEPLEHSESRIVDTPQFIINYKNGTETGNYEDDFIKVEHNPVGRPSHWGIVFEAGMYRVTLKNVSKELFVDSGDLVIKSLGIYVLVRLRAGVTVSFIDSFAVGETAEQVDELMDSRE